jgi:hypothetical protein
MSKEIRIEKPFGSLSIYPDGESIIVLSECADEVGHIMAITREEARMLHTELGEMLGSFVPVE